MRKIVIAVVLAFAVHFAPRAEGQQGSDHDDHHANNQAISASASTYKNERVAGEAKTGQIEAPTSYKSPEGALVLVGIITFLAIGYQSIQTKRSVDAAYASIRLQEATLQQWVDLVNWKAEYIPSITGQPSFLKITVDIVNPTDFPITICRGRITLGGNTTFFLVDEFVMTPRNPYVANLGTQITDDQEKNFLRTGLWFSVRGELSHIGTLGKLNPQPIYGHLTCLSGQDPIWHPDMPESNNSGLGYPSP